MVVMTVPRSDELPPLNPGPITRAELDAMPDDGRRHELLDGILLVTPAPAPKHQRVVRRLSRLLEDACPEALEVFFAPLAWR